VDEDEKIQGISDEETEPADLSWNTSLTAAGGLHVGALDVSRNHGLWIHREFPVGGTRAAIYRNVINVQFLGAEE